MSLIEKAGFLLLKIKVLALKFDGNSRGKLCNHFISDYDLPCYLLTVFKGRGNQRSFFIMCPLHFRRQQSIFSFSQNKKAKRVPKASKNGETPYFCVGCGHYKTISFLTLNPFGDIGKIPFRLFPILPQRGRKVCSTCYNRNLNFVKGSEQTLAPMSEENNCDDYNPNSNPNSNPNNDHDHIHEEISGRGFLFLPFHLHLVSELLFTADEKTDLQLMFIGALWNLKDPERCIFSPPFDFNFSFFNASCTKNAKRADRSTIRRLSLAAFLTVGFS